METVGFGICFSGVYLELIFDLLIYTYVLIVFFYIKLSYLGRVMLLFCLGCVWIQVMGCNVIGEINWGPQMNPLHNFSWRVY